MIINARNHNCRYFLGEMSSKPSAGGHTPFNETVRSFEEASELSGVPAKTIADNVNKHGVSTSNGKPHPGDRGSAWVFEVIKEIN